jgi:hypothetical protein
MINLVHILTEICPADSALYLIRTLNYFISEIFVRSFLYSIFLFQKAQIQTKIYLHICPVSYIYAYQVLPHVCNHYLTLSFFIGVGYPFIMGYFDNFENRSLNKYKKKSYK